MHREGSLSHASGGARTRLIVHRLFVRVRQNLVRGLNLGAGGARASAGQRPSAAPAAWKLAEAPFVRPQGRSGFARAAARASLNLASAASSFPWFLSGCHFLCSKGEGQVISGQR